MSLITVLQANFIRIESDSREAYLPLTSTDNGPGSIIERMLAEKVAKCVSKRSKVEIVVLEKKDPNLHFPFTPPLFFSTDINLARRGDANKIKDALKAAQRLFENSVKVLVSQTVSKTIFLQAIGCSFEFGEYDGFG